MGIFPETHLSLVAGNENVEDLFEREWVRSVLTLALEGLQRDCTAAGRDSTYQAFVAHDVEGADLDVPPSYAEVAQRLGLPVTQVANYLHWARTRFRAQVLGTLRALTTTDEEYRDEARSLLGRVPE